MPLFEYHCAGCDSDVELLIRGDEKPECPGCGGDKLEKLLSAPFAHTASSSSLPICGAPAPDACGMGSCEGGCCPMM